MNDKKLTRFRFEATVQEANQTNKDYLEEEIKYVLESNKAYQSKCDYLGYSILSIDEKISLLDEEIRSLKSYKDKLKQAKEIALQATAKVFNDYGITKIEGAGISSITVQSTVETTKLELDVHNEEALISQGFYKKVLDEKKVLEAYVNGEYKDLITNYADINRVIYVRPSKVRINKRRGSNNDYYDGVDICDEDIG